MKKAIALASLFLLLSIAVSIWWHAKNRMQDEFMYALKASHLLFALELKPESDEGKTLNTLLLLHLNRFLVAKQYVPSVFVTEEYELFCGSFNIPSKSMVDFDKYASEKLQQYLVHATRGCNYGE